MRPTLLAGGALAVTALAAPAAAQAHVTLQPNHTAAGSFTRLDVRVPTERDDASTVKVDLQLPAGFAEGSDTPAPTRAPIRPTAWAITALIAGIAGVAGPVAARRTRVRTD